jgi:tetraacyldisaccharide 4'-kinase
VSAGSTAATVGDEPLLIWRRTGVPVWVGRDRAAALRALCTAHPEVDIVLSDDGLQHRALGRVAEVLVFDERGAGNGLLLPAGPLREPLPPALAPWQRVVFAGARPPPLQPATPLQRRLGMAWPLDAWWAGDASACQPLAVLQGRPLLAVAGLGEPEKFFAMLEAAGLAITRSPQPDHAPYARLPWPAGTAEVVLTEKDAVKLPPQRVAGTRVWVLGLDLDMPGTWVDDLLALLPPRPAPPCSVGTPNAGAGAGAAGSPT